jgi:hypothetical protein
MSDSSLVPIEAEIVEEHSLVPAPHSSLANLFGADSPVQVVEKASEVARVLVDVIKRANLAINLGGKKDHVQFEGWQTLGSMLGLSAVLAWSKPISDENGEWREPVWHLGTVKKPSKYKAGETYEKEERIVDSPGKGGWESRVEVFDRDGRMVSAGEMECRWSERNWQDRDSYALRSMSETRAAAKGYKIPLGFVMVLGGYSGTPAEEMDGIVGRTADPLHTPSGLKCPSCGSEVTDQRETATGKMPLFKCSNRGCRGGKDGKFSWASWDAEWAESAGDGATVTTVRPRTPIQETVDALAKAKGDWDVAPLAVPELVVAEPDVVRDHAEHSEPMPEHKSDPKPSFAELTALLGTLPQWREGTADTLEANTRRVYVLMQGLGIWETKQGDNADPFHAGLARFGDIVRRDPEKWGVDVAALRGDPLQHWGSLGNKQNKQAFAALTVTWAENRLEKGKP